MTKLKGIKKLEVTAPGILRPVVIEIDEQARSVRIYEKRSRIKYQIGTTLLFRLIVVHGKEINTKEEL